MVNKKILFASAVVVCLLLLALCPLPEANAAPCPEFRVIFPQNGGCTDAIVMELLHTKSNV